MIKKSDLEKFVFTPGHTAHTTQSRLGCGVHYWENYFLLSKDSAILLGFDTDWLKVAEYLHWEIGGKWWLIRDEKVDELMARLNLGILDFSAMYNDGSLAAMKKRNRKIGGDIQLINTVSRSLSAIRKYDSFYMVWLPDFCDLVGIDYEYD